MNTLNLGRIVSDQELVQLAERRAREPPSVKVKVPPVRQTAPVQAKRRPTTKRPQRAAHKQLVGQPQKLPAVRPEHWADDTSALLFANPAASSTSLWPGPEQLAAERPVHARAATPPAAWVARHKECLRRQTSHWSRSGERAATPLIPPRLTSSSHAAIRGGGATRGGAALMSGASAPHLERRRSPPRTAAADARRPLLRGDSSSDPRRLSPPHTVAIDASSSGWPDSPPRSQTAAADARRPRVSSGSPPFSSAHTRQRSQQRRCAFVGTST